MYCRSLVSPSINVSEKFISVLFVHKMSKSADHEVPVMFGGAGDFKS